MLDAKIILDHDFVPKHEILTKKATEEALKQFNATKEQLPRIKVDDPVAEAIGAKKGQVLKITRKSITAGETVYYRLVV